MCDANFIQSNLKVHIMTSTTRCTKPAKLGLIPLWFERQSIFCMHTTFLLFVIESMRNFYANLKEFQKNPELFICFSLLNKIQYKFNLNVTRSNHYVHMCLLAINLLAIAAQIERLLFCGLFATGSQSLQISVRNVEIRYFKDL